MNDKERPYYQKRVIVKFRNSISLPYREGVELNIMERKIGNWAKLVKDFPGVVLLPLFDRWAPERVTALVQRAMKLTPSYSPPNFLTYFVLICPDKIDLQAVVKALSAWGSVETAYIESGPADPPSVNYLNPAREGIDATFARTQTGGIGSLDINLVDIEQGWQQNEPGLPPSTLVSGCNKFQPGHGAAVLGILAGTGNGIVQDITISLASQWMKQKGHEYRGCIVCSVAKALENAIDHLELIGNVGDIILIEAQTDRSLPFEVELAVLDLIQLATSLHINVVEAAGNGNSNIDSFLAKDGNGNPIDSGAIIVGAAFSDLDHKRTSVSNYGTFVRFYSWGENITSQGIGSSGGFGGTSGASAIVAGAVVAVQSSAIAVHGNRYKPTQLRNSILVEGATLPNGSDHPIGVMPNLAGILAKVATTAPI